MSNELLAALLGAILPTLVGGFIAASQKRGEEQRAAAAARAEEQRRDTGVRVGKLERQADFERGRRAGLREAERQNRTRRNGG